MAEDMRQQAGMLLWRPEVGRFAGWQDLAGTFYDYGFTFVNLEAVHYGLATPEQARSIFEWLDGKRLVEGDTSTARTSTIGDSARAPRPNAILKPTSGVGHVRKIFLGAGRFRTAVPCWASATSI